MEAMVRGRDFADEAVQFGLCLSENALGPGRVPLLPGDLAERRPAHGDPEADLGSRRSPRFGGDDPLADFQGDFVFRCRAIQILGQKSQMADPAVDLGWEPEIGRVASLIRDHRGESQGLGKPDLGLCYLLLLEERRGPGGLGEGQGSSEGSLARVLGRQRPEDFQGGPALLERLGRRSLPEGDPG